MLLTDSLKANARNRPVKPAVIDINRRMTYAELDLFSDILAHELMGKGVERGDRVAIFIENSCEYVVSYFGVLKAGAAVVPLNVQMVERELLFLLNDCSPKAVLTEKRRLRTFGNILQQSQVPLFVLAVDLAELSGKPPAGGSFPSLTEEDLASIIYTSGTTGKPKGVMLTHGNVCANADSIIEYLRITPEDRVMTVLPFYYSYGASLLTTHIRAGGTLIIDNRFLYPNLILETMAQEAATGFAGVPSHYALLLRGSGLRDYRFPALRYVTQAGGPMSPALIQEFLDALPGVQFIVMYGQTEATARLSYLDPASLRAKMGSIGKAIPGVELSVILENGEQARPGQAGEIVARGRNIMRGYWNAPSETATVLRDGALFTGDLARTDEDGFLYVVSRKKDMIKSGANRISPREIEDVVCQMPGILECAAVGVPDELLGEAIQLFVVPVEGARLDEREIVIFCRQNLAAYKVPRQVRVLPALPKTASGKVKREELKGHYAAGS